MDWNSGYVKHRLETPITLEKIQSEGLIFRPNLDAELRLDRHLNNVTEDFDLHDSDAVTVPRAHVEKPPCSSRPNRARRSPKVSPVFAGLRLDKRPREITPILDGVDEVNRLGVSPLTPYNELEKKFFNVTIDGNLKKRITEVGYGRLLPLDAEVWVNYEMWGDGMDDVIFRTKHPFKFTFFQPNIMYWLDLGVSTMYEFETAWFIVKPELGFGDVGMPGLVPGGTTLLFKVEVVRFKPGILSKSRPDLVTSAQGYKYEQIMMCVNALKSRASELLRDVDKDWKRAYNLYRKAAHFLDKDYVTDPEEAVDMFKNMFTLHNNMALCTLKLEKYDEVIFHSEKALQLPEVAHTPHPKSKLFYRRATAELEKGHADAAMEFVLKSKKCSGPNMELEELERRVRTALKENELSQKNLFRKMMSFVSTP